MTETRTEREVVTSDTPTGTVHREVNVATNGADGYEFAINKINYVIYVLVGIINLLIVLRFVFFLLGANPTGFVRFIYNLTDVFVLPFRGVFDEAQVGESYFDTASLLAIAMWSVLAFIMIMIVNLFSKKTA